MHLWNYLNGPCLAHDYTDPTCEGVTRFIDEWVEEYQKNNRCIRRTNRKGYQSEAKRDLDDMPDEY